MNAKLENKLDMYRVTLLLAENNNAIISTMPALQTRMASFKLKVKGIDNTVQEQIIVIKGIAIDKSILKNECAVKTMTVSNPLVAFANAEGDFELAREAKYTKTALLRMREGELIGVAHHVHELGNTHLLSLGDYGVTAAILSELSDAIDAYEVKTAEPKEARDNKKMLTAKLDTLFEECDDLLKNEIDMLVAILPDTYRDFKELYKNARTIIDYRGRPKGAAETEGFGSIEGVVLNAEDGSPIEDALLKIVGTELTAESDEDGEYYFEKVAAGVVSISVEAQTYVSVVKSDVELPADGHIDVDFELEADESIADENE